MSLRQFVRFSNENLKLCQRDTMKLCTRCESKKCVEKCEDPKLRKLKEVQNKFQSDEKCPVWLVSGMDKVLSYTTFALTGIGAVLSIYNVLVVLG